ncbi:MAG: GYF domain-containing protein [Pseudobdellovibrionaceae bacterium]
MSRFYYLRSGQAVGPIDESRLVDLVKDGTLLSSDNLFKEGSSEWKPISEFVALELFKKMAEEILPEPVVAQVSITAAPPPLPEVDVRWVLLKRKSGGSGQPEFDQKTDLKTVEVEKMIVDRKIDCHDFLWKEGFREWTPADQVPQFKKEFETLLALRSEVKSPLSIPATAPQIVAPQASVPIIASAPMATNPFADLEKNESKKTLLDSLNLVKSISPEIVASRSVETPAPEIQQGSAEKVPESQAPIKVQEFVAAPASRAEEPFVLKTDFEKKANVPEMKPAGAEAAISIKVAAPQTPKFLVEDTIADEKKEKSGVIEKTNSTESGASKKQKKPVKGKEFPLGRIAFAAGVAGFVALGVYEWKVTKGEILVKYAGLPTEVAEQIFGKVHPESSMPVEVPIAQSPPHVEQMPPTLSEPTVQAAVPPPPSAVEPQQFVSPPQSAAAKTITPPASSRLSVPSQRESKSVGLQVGKKMETAGGSSEFVVLYPVPLTLSDNIEFSGVKSESLKVNLTADAGQVLGKIRFSETKVIDRPVKGKWGIDLSDWNLTEGTYQLSVNGDSTSWSRKIVIAQDPTKLKNALEAHRKKISYQVQTEKKLLYRASQKLASQVKVLNQVKNKGSVPSSWFRGMKAANTPQMIRAKSSSEDMAFPEQWRKLSELHSKLSGVGQMLKTSGKRAPAQAQSIREVEKNIDVLSKKIGSLSLRFD